jgi:hypothetical protein
MIHAEMRRCASIMKRLVKGAAGISGCRKLDDTQ